MGYAKAKIKLKTQSKEIEEYALVDSGSSFTIIDKEFAKQLNIKYTGRKIPITSISGNVIFCNEGILDSIIIEDELIIQEVVDICRIPENVKELLKRIEVLETIVIGLHTIERIGYVIDTVTHRLIKSPSALAI